MNDLARSTTASKTELDGPRQARLEDLDGTIALLNYVFRTLAGREPTIALDHPHIYSPANVDNVSIVCCGDRVVASTGVFAAGAMLGNVDIRIGDINCVGVLPDYRRHGLGAQVMAAARRRMLELGCHAALLVTDLDNWYRALGWERAGSKRTYRVDLGNVHLLPELPPGINLSFGGEESIDDVLRLHHAGRLGAVRTADVFRLVLRGKRNPQILLAERDGQALAYALARDSTIVEWAGEAELVAGLARAFFHYRDDTGISRSMRDTAFKATRLQCTNIITPGGGHPLMDLLDERRLPFSQDYIGMATVLDPAGLLRAFGHEDIVISEQRGLFTVSRGGESATLSSCQLVKLFFGPERVSDLAPDVFPLPFWQWPLDIF